MTKFEEEFKALTSWEWVNVDLIQQILTRFGNWHSDEEFQIVEEIGGSFALANKNLIDANTKLAEEIANLKSQLQQQALPVVPECVAEWYEEHKDDLDYSIYSLCEEFDDTEPNREPTEFESWFDIVSNQPILTLVGMRNGYTVEKPQLFYIELPNVYGLKNKICVSKVENETIVEFSNGKNYALKFTEQEIKSIDERYWQFAVPVEDNK